MRTVSGGRGDEPREDGPRAISPDDEATRVFTREALATPQPEPGDALADPVPGTEEATREFERDGYAVSDAVPAGREWLDEDGRTRVFVRPEPGGARPRSRRGSGAVTGRRRRRLRLRLRWVVVFVVLTALAVPPGTWAWVWYTARQDDRTPSHAIVVLGASQYNGTPSPIFEARLRHAQELYHQGVAPVIVTVGGKQPGDNFTEAESGRNWLVEVGVPGEQIVAVEEGSDTLQSIAAVSEVFEANDWSTAILVSDPWHSLRSQQMAGDFGIEAGTSPARSGPAVIERETQLWYITRETASLWYYWIFNDSSDIRVDAA